MQTAEIVVLVGPTNAYYQDMFSTHLPVFWTSEGANITKDLADEMALGIYTAVGVAEAFISRIDGASVCRCCAYMWRQGLYYSGYILGPLCLAASGYFFTKWHKEWYVPRDRHGDLGGFAGGERQRLINNDNDI
jgi:hypothetical protein